MGKMAVVDGDVEMGVTTDSHAHRKITRLRIRPVHIQQLQLDDLHERRERQIYGLHVPCGATAGHGDGVHV